MSLTLISATPSPYARINRIALHLKSIPFTLLNEIPWHKTETQTPQYNPLEKLPVLMFPPEEHRAPIYDSSHIQDFLVTRYADRGPRLVTGEWEADMKLKQVQVLAQGVMDAVVLKFFERARGEEKASREWEGRQDRKILTIADIAVVCAVGFVGFNGALGEGWEGMYPETARYFAVLDGREGGVSGDEAGDV
ncbi:hypothetical protein M409DRAFT_66814 [Zasmidium cellare ATCC 36951]|uniref:GST N-terminal domain-containing protein n=1 Tax=Zasmidium cellare ATCC 36951 TaxID=1080233 RepID=A0A6A6CK89_ZASCE|nr:uncharacterized protein M409DRAFT_66814 [Zasmidium cellare ATCC 36951]KAF2166372.1 hypothetical protein M409DRAFT_66814 [Zasmidium cellare ATCC 36951]